MKRRVMIDLTERQAATVKALVDSAMEVTTVPGLARDCKAIIRRIQRAELKALTRRMQAVLARQ